MVREKDLQNTVKYATELNNDDRIKIYLSGPVSIYNDNDFALQKFNEKQKELESYLPEYSFRIVNPVDFNMKFDDISGMSWSDFMICDLLLLNSCDWIYLMDGWQISEGAMMEKEFATKRGMKVINNLTLLLDKFKNIMLNGEKVRVDLADENGDYTSEIKYDTKTDNFVETRINRNNE